MRTPRTFAANPCAFTLVELLVVVAIVGILIALIVPSLVRARDVARTTKCLSNMRGMETAHWIYMTEWDGWMVDVGLAHGGAHAHESIAWINTLQKYYGHKLLHRSPVDDSPHWPVEEGGQGVPVPPTADQFRRTSYGVNGYLTDVAPLKPVRRLDDVPRPGATVHFLIMAFEGEYAGADHPHVENWYISANPDASPVLASRQVQIDAHGGRPESWDSVSNYGFLDGRAETLPFRKVYVDITQNSFDPEVAR